MQRGRSPTVCCALCASRNDNQALPSSIRRTGSSWSSFHDRPPPLTPLTRGTSKDSLSENIAPSKSQDCIPCRQHLYQTPTAQNSSDSLLGLTRVKAHKSGFWCDTAQNSTDSLPGLTRVKAHDPDPHRQYLNQARTAQNSTNSLPGLTRVKAHDTESWRDIAQPRPSTLSREVTSDCLEMAMSAGRKKRNELEWGDLPPDYADVVREEMDPSFSHSNQQATLVERLWERTLSALIYLPWLSVFIRYLNCVHVGSKQSSFTTGFRLLL